MTLLNGFFLVNFLPFGLIVLAGLLLFFLRNDKPAKWYYPLLFIVIILIVISFWRIPILIDRRYAMPTLVPGIILSVFVIMLLPGILKHFNVKYATTIVRAMIVILLAACSAKTMREQEHKPYLQEIPEALQKNCDKNNVKKAVVLVFGNLGGHLVFDIAPKAIDIPTQNINDSLANIGYPFIIINGVHIKIICLPKQHINDKFAEPAYQISNLNGILDLKLLENQYSHIYLLCVEQIPENFCNLWMKKYINKPELVYEHINRKQIAYRLYRVK